MSVRIIKISGRKNYALRWTDAAGVVRQRSAKTTSMRDASRAAAKLESELTESERLNRSGWDALRCRFEREHVAALDANSRAAYASALNRIETALGPETSEDITDEFLARFVAECRADELAAATIQCYLRHLRKFWAYLVQWGVISREPRATAPRVSRRSGGRPLTLEEFERLLAATATVVGNRLETAWHHDLWLLWLSGLRLGEAYSLSWDDATAPQIRGIHRSRPMLWIPENWDKSRRESLTPLTPDCVDWLRCVADQTGYVANFMSRRGHRYNRVDSVGKVIAAIGQAAGVVAGRTDRGDPRYASAHDLRRSFGTRWAPKVQAAVLQRLMRHKSIQTTMTYYVDVDAQQIADQIWSAEKRDAVDQIIERWG